MLVNHSYKGQFWADEPGRKKPEAEANLDELIDRLKSTCQKLMTLPGNYSRILAENGVIKLDFPWKVKLETGCLILLCQWDEAKFHDCPSTQWGMVASRFKE